MHRLTVFCNASDDLSKQVGEAITCCGYTVHRGEHLESCVQYYFDGIKDSVQNIKIFEKCREILYPKKIDFVIQEPYLPIKLICFDMDGTVVNLETMDELAGRYLGDDVKHFMQTATLDVIEGRVDYKDGFKKKNALLEGLKRDCIFDFCENTVKFNFNEGLIDFLNFAHNNFVKTALISGGFIDFAKFVANQAGFCYYHASKPNFKIDLKKQEVFTGDIDEESILTTKDKGLITQSHTKNLGLDKYNVCAIGDGSNDIEMLKEAGLGIAYKAKEIVKQNVNNWIEFSDYRVLKDILF